MILQHDLTVSRFAEVVGALLKDQRRRRQMAEAARDRGKPNAADEIVTHIVALFGA